MTRPSTDIERNALKTGFKRIVALVGGVDAAASVTRVARSNLSEYGVPQLPDRHVPVDVLLDLERTAGAPFVTELLAAQQGYTLLPMQVGEGDVAEALAVVSETAGKTLADGLQAVRDGMPPDERAHLVADLTALGRAVAHTLAQLRAAAPAEVVAVPIMRAAG